MHPRVPALSTLLLLAAASCGAPPAPEVTSGPHWMLGPDGCRPGQHRQPGGTSVATVSCEKEGGATLAVAAGDASEPWQAAPWAAGVTSLAWAPDGKRLFVGTSDVHGAGGFFELDVGARTARQLMPAGDAVSAAQPGPGYVITTIDVEKQVLRYQVAPVTADDRGAALSIARGG